MSAWSRPAPPRWAGELRQERTWLHAAVGNFLSRKSLLATAGTGFGGRGQGVSFAGGWFFCLEPPSREGPVALSWPGEGPRRAPEPLSRRPLPGHGWPPGSWGQVPMKPPAPPTQARTGPEAVPRTLLGAPPRLFSVPFQCPSREAVTCTALVEGRGPGVRLAVVGRGGGQETTTGPGALLRSPDQSPGVSDACLLDAEAQRDAPGE